MKPVPVILSWCREWTGNGQIAAQPSFFLLLVVAVSHAAGFLQAPPAHAETRFTPSGYLSERYDSNIFRGPKNVIPPGTQSWDLVTTLGAQARLENKSRLGDSVIDVGVNGNVFAYNPNLAFVSTNVSAASDLSGWTEELFRGLRLRVSDSFLYTPETPAFLAPGRTAEASDVFSRGIQAVRANTFSNILRTQSDYSLSRAVDLHSEYSYSIFRSGQLRVISPTVFGATFFDSTLHTARAGPAYRFEGGDTLFLSYTYNTAESVPVSGEGRSIRYSAHTMEPEYVSTFFRDWTLTMSGGATIVEQAGSRAFFTGRLSLATNVDQALRVQGSVSRRVAPAFFGIGGALISNLVQLYVSQRFSETLLLSGSVSYAKNESTPVKVFTFESIVASAALEYQLTRTYKVSLIQEYNRSAYTGVDTFDRFATMFVVTAEWK